MQLSVWLSCRVLLCDNLILPFIANKMNESMNCRGRLSKVIISRHVRLHILSTITWYRPIIVLSHKVKRWDVDGRRHYCRPLMCVSRPASLKRHK